jgi:hypothetical protein
VSSSPAWLGKGGGRVYGSLGFGLELGRWGKAPGGRARRQPGDVAAAAAGFRRGRPGEKEWSGSVDSLGARGGEGQTDSAGAAQVRRFAGARPGIDGVPRGTGPLRTGGSRL